MGWRTEPESDEVHGLTDAAESRVVSQQRRMKQYLVLMGIRIACLLLIFVTPPVTWWFWVIGAVFIPYFAVVLASQSRRSRGTRNGHAHSNSLSAGQRQALHDSGPSAPDRSTDDVVVGEVISVDDGA